MLVIRQDIAVKILREMIEGDNVQKAKYLQDQLTHFLQDPELKPFIELISGLFLREMKVNPLVAGSKLFGIIFTLRTIEAAMNEKKALLASESQPQS